MMKRLDEKGKCTSSVIEKLINTIYSSQEWEEYVGVKLYYLRKNTIR